MEYKTTLNMPQTKFEMKANLNTKEPKIQQQWISSEIENKIYLKNKDKKKYTLHDGPPYANGFLHMGHALNKILKDIVVRYKNMNEFNSVFISGWDTHGMPIEVALSKKGKNKDPNLSIVQKRDNCLNFAKEWIEKQKIQFLRMGLMTSMENIYQTFDPKFEIEQLRIFNKMLFDNLIFQDLKPIYWSWSSQTALAEAEVEYKDVESNSIYVSFNVKKSNVLKVGDKLLIWTTTPWTIPSNLAIAIKPDANYVRIETSKGFLVLLKSNIDSIMSKINILDYKIILEFRGSELEHTEYKHPLYEKNGIVINATYVSESDGTGLVHNAPGFGNDDYLACKKYNINPFCPIDELGKFTKEVNDLELEGLFYNSSNEIIINRLKNTNNLLHSEKITHSTAHDWRTKKPLIYRATKQWFVNISKINKEINASLDNVTSPQGDSIIQKIREMINGRLEWCISRQRYWGVPIIIIYDENKNPIIDVKLQDYILDILSKEGINIWFEKNVEYFLPKNYDRKKKYYKEKDIMDVWFDSGTSHNILKLNNLPYPADLYLEGKDQFRGWFNSSLITGVAYHNEAPYKSLICHGFVLDKDGKKMSKSIGNIIDPISVCNEYGADVLRIWVASTDYSTDVKIFNDLLKQTAEIYRRIRNTIFKFILGNLSDFNSFEEVKYSCADKFILDRTNTLLKAVKLAYESFDYKNIIKSMNEFSIELSSWYFDYIKDTLYCEKQDNKSRRAIQSVLHHIINAYLILLNPIIPHTCEEAYTLFQKENKLESIQLEEFKNIHEYNDLDIDHNKWIEFFQLKDNIYIKLEEARNKKLINKNNEATVVIDSESIPFKEDKLSKYLNVYKVIFNISKLQKINIVKEESKKCLRCWNHFDKEEIINNEICIRCYNNIK